MKWRFVVGAALLLAACSPPVPRNTGVYLLVDTSGSYARQVTKAQQIILFALSRLQPLDSFAVARIDTASFTSRTVRTAWLSMSALVVSGSVARR